MGAEVVTDYAYDEINRLTREATCDFMNRYYYDDGGNRTKLVHMNAVYSKDGNGRIVSMLTKASESNQGLTKTYYYANFTELTKMTASEYGGTTRDYTYEHDMAGRLTRQVQNVFSPNSTTTYNYEWDALDRMTKVQRVASGVTKTINYTYNADNLRVRRVDTSTNVTKLYSYQDDNIASIQESSGGSYGSKDWIYTIAPGSISNALERHQPNYATGQTTSQYYQFDHRGNVMAVSDSTGNILRGYQFDAFGNISYSFEKNGGSAPTDDILFTGKDLDTDTGLYYFNARWYDPDIGQFLSRSALTPNHEHPYLFCQPSPMRMVDVDGNGPTEWFKGVYLDPWERRYSSGRGYDNCMRHCVSSCEFASYWGTTIAWFAYDIYYERYDPRGKGGNDPELDLMHNKLGRQCAQYLTSGKAHLLDNCRCCCYRFCKWYHPKAKNRSHPAITTLPTPAVVPI
jgi:RHS repeat-associated protein